MTASALVTDVQWVLFGLLALLAITAILSISTHASLAIAHDALPYLLGLAWVILVVSLIQGAWILSACAAVLVAYHLVLLVPRFWRVRQPTWVQRSPTVEMLVSNVFIDNETPDLLAAQLVGSGVDIMIITEWNDRFARAFDAAGGGDSYPHMVVDEDDHTDYAVCVKSRLPLEPGSEMVSIGPLKMARARVRVGSRTLQVIGLNPKAAVDPGGYKEWKEQIEALTHHLPQIEPPVVFGGDLNTTQFRPEYKALLRAGLSDAHDMLGRGMSTSFKLSATGILASPGTVVRLDHALVSKDVHPVETTDLEARGSDHLPFRITLAVRQERRPAIHLPHRRRRPAPVG